LAAFSTAAGTSREAAKTQLSIQRTLFYLRWFFVPGLGIAVAGMLVTVIFVRTSLAGAILAVAATEPIPDCNSS